MMTPRGFLADEGPAHSLAIMTRVAPRPANIRKMAWLMPRMAKAVPCPFGYSCQRGNVICAAWGAPAGPGCSTPGGTTGKPASHQAANPPARSVAFRKPSRCRAAAARLD
jgi:hypothetical protein